MNTQMNDYLVAPYNFWSPAEQQSKRQCLSLCPESKGHKRRLMIWRVMGPAAVAAAFRAFFLKRHSLALMTWFYWLTTKLEIMMLHMHEII